jgi:hypothetical protein
MLKWTNDTQIAYIADQAKRKERAPFGSASGGQVDFDTGNEADLGHQLER